MPPRTVTLHDQALPQISHRLAVPGYRREGLVPSIVHIGVGGFHRAHQAVYLDDLASQGETGWGVVGVGLRSRATSAALGAQDHLFTVVEQDGRMEQARVVGTLTDCHFAPDDPAAVLGRLADPRTRIVSLTITGGAYDLADDRHAGEPRGASPTSWYGYLTRALAQRRRDGVGGFTVLSCDNLPDSGDAARRALVGFAARHDETLARWIERHVSFPHSMVDRITPQSGAELTDLVARRFGVHDRAAVRTEAFSQWVVEDDFCAGRPDWEAVGVQVVDDVRPYKLVKTRLLNGVHTAMAYLGVLAGHATTADMAHDPAMRAFLVRLMHEEIAPLLPDLPQMRVDDYADSVLERLGNVSVSDPLTRLCARGSTKVPSYLLPSLVESRRLGRPAPLLTLALAAWFRYLRGDHPDGRALEIADAARAELQPLAVRGGTDPGPLLDWLARRGVLDTDPGLHRDLSSALRALDRGVPAAVARQVARAEHPARRCAVARLAVDVRGEPDLIS